MSETFATSRPSGGAEEFERRRRSLVPGSDAGGDPLAELARLVGKDDPFRGVAPQIRPTLVPPGQRAGFRTFDDGFHGAIDAGEEAGTPDDPSIVHAGLDRPASRGGAEHGRLIMRTPAIPDVSADSWARGSDPVVPAVEPQGQPAGRDTPASEGSSRRTLIVLAAVIALTGGGLGASFLAKSSSQGVVAVATSSTPTILAAAGPSKVQPVTPAAEDPNAPSEPSTLLDKNKNDGTATAKIVNSVEQPVDLGQAIKPVAPAIDGDQTAATTSPFPEPRKVKTVLVRPDGTIISDRPAAAAEAVTQGTASSLAFDPKTSLPMIESQPAAAPAAPPPPAAPVAAAPVAAASTPAKSKIRVAVTPKTADAGAGTPVTQGHAAGDTPRAAAAAVKPPAKTEDADGAATPADTATASVPSGKFAAQLGAAGSEAEARDLSARLSRKFADAVGGRLSVHKAQSGDRTVYRVRLSGLGQDAAKAVCAKISSGGGGCFVARD